MERIKRIALSLADLQDLLSTMREQDLDFDDAYQYVAARNNDLILVSFDKDFDSTDMKRKTPAMIMAEKADYN